MFSCVQIMYTMFKQCSFGAKASFAIFVGAIFVPSAGARCYCKKGYPKLYLCKYSILAGSSYLCQIQAVALLCGGHVYGRCHPQATGSGYDGDPRRRRWR